MAVSTSVLDLGTERNYSSISWEVTNYCNPLKRERKKKGNRFDEGVKLQTNDRRLFPFDSRLTQDTQETPFETFQISETVSQENSSILFPVYSLLRIFYLKRSIY